MKKHGIESAITSIGIPGGINDYEFLGKLSRWCNEYSAKLKHDYPDKFGAFANIPLPDIKTSLKERSN
jgi:predicted TIM-barrel fold metal-dependent hydrolase